MKGTTRTFVIALAMATILATVATGAAVAGKGAGSIGATIVFDPNPEVVVGAQYVVSGSGFRPNAWVTVGAHYDTVYWYAVVTDGNGNFSYTVTARATGQILHEAKEQTRSGRLRLRATGMLTVVGG